MTIKNIVTKDTVNDSAKSLDIQGKIEAANERDRKSIY